MKISRTIVGLTALVWLIVSALPALAIDQPDSGFAIEDVEAFTNVAETGDLLVLMTYNIPYASLPTDFAANEAYLFQLLDGTDVIGQNTPYAYQQDGYNRGLGSIYLSQAQTEAAGLTNSAGVWTAWGPTTLTAKLIGNPSAFGATQPTTSATLGATDFTSDETAATNDAALSVQIRTVAASLQQSWGTTLLSDDPNILSSAGAQYFTLAVPGLAAMISDVFLISTQNPNFPTPVPTPGTFASQSRDRYAATEWIDGGFNALSTDTGLPVPFLKTGIAFIGIIILTVLGGIFLGQTGATVGFLGGIAIGVPVLMTQGFVEWSVGALFLAVIVVYGILKQFQRSQQ